MLAMPTTEVQVRLTRHWGHGSGRVLNPMGWTRAMGSCGELDQVNGGWGHV